MPWPLNSLYYLPKLTQKFCARIWDPPSQFRQTGLTLRRPLLRRSSNRQFQVLNGTVVLEWKFPWSPEAAPTEARRPHGHKSESSAKWGIDPFGISRVLEIPDTPMIPDSANALADWIDEPARRESSSWE